MPISFAISLRRRGRRLINFAGRYLNAAALVAHTFTLGLASPRRRHLISQLARRANYRGFPRAELPVIAVESITSELTSVALPCPEGVEGNVSLLELLVLARLVKERAPRSLFEIGTFNGRTTLALAANSPQDAIVYTLDLPPDHPTRFRVLHTEQGFVDKPASGELLRRSPAASKVRQLYGDSATFDFSPYQADFVFVDGSHAYEYVRSDSERALALLRNGRGTVIWHDYGEWEGVTEALNELRASDPRFASIRWVAGTTMAFLQAPV